MEINEGDSRAGNPNGVKCTALAALSLVLVFSSTVFGFLAIRPSSADVILQQFPMSEACATAPLLGALWPLFRVAPGRR